MRYTHLRTLCERSRFSRGWLAGRQQVLGTAAPVPHDACKARVAPLLRSLLLVSSYQLVMLLGAEHPIAWLLCRLVPSAVT